MRAIRYLFIIVVGILLFPFANSYAAVPLMINYQGHVKDSTGSPVNGDGYFKFAIVDSAGTTTHWSNDSTSTVGDEPTGSVIITVSNGLFAAKLGDTVLMDALPAAVFDNEIIYLRVWFSADDTTYEQMDPDMQIVSTGFAIRAGNVVDGSITAAKLAANQTLTVAGINYSAPKSASITIPAPAFFPANSTLAYNKAVTAGSNGFTSVSAPSTNGYFIAPISIPNGVTITGLELRLFDGSATGYVTADISRLGTIVTNSTAGSADTEVGGYLTKTSGAINEIISSDVATYYFVRVFVTEASTSLGFYAVKIIYQYTSP